MAKDIKNPVEIDETDLDTVNGGLPAIQKVREAANRTSATAGDLDGDGRDDIITGTVATGHVK